VDKLPVRPETGAEGKTELSVSVGVKVGGEPLNPSLKDGRTGTEQLETLWDHSDREGTAGTLLRVPAENE
jgi:hypothetical protein